MKIPFQLDVIVLFALIVQGIFVAVLLPFLKANQKANRYLAALLFLFSLWICDTFFRVAGIYAQNPGYYFLPIYFSLAFGPLIYWYTRSLTSVRFAFRARHLLHFLPALVQGIFYVYLQTRDYRFRRDFWFNVHQPFTYDLEFILSFLSLLFYLLLSLGQIRAYKRRIENHFSNLQKITLSWLRTIHLALFFLAAFWLADALLRLVLDYYLVTPLSTISMGITMLLLAVGGILQKDLTNVNEEAREEVASQEGEPEVDEAILARIREAMIREELFLRQELTLKQFARSLQLPPRTVSHHLNAGLGLSFIDFVNQYRVEYVKQLMAEGRLGHLTLFGMALESGFNSKSTFNRVFKKCTGKSPSEYQKGLKT